MDTLWGPRAGPEDSMAAIPMKKSPETIFYFIFEQRAEKGRLLCPA
jgi:hypothetical protein